jgi:serine/threonine protein kinase
VDPHQQGQPPDLIIGQTIGNYLVTQKLGEGGMGTVYLAEHPGIGKKVAIKVLHSEFSTNRGVTERFFHEAKAVNDIGHPNIVDIVDYGILQTSNGQLVYFIMEFLGGTTLASLIRGEIVPPERALSIAMQVADALSASHKCNIVHRDLKPDNIMLLQRGRERDFVKLLDFGIAKLTGNLSGSQRTQTGVIMGTPAYMSPEQCDGRGNIDLRTDVYALGIVIYEMLTGRVPFTGEGYGEVIVKHLAHAPTPPSQFRMMNPHLEAVVMKALEKNPDLRFPNMDEFMRAMADPVGFVEAHGGIAGFPQRQLMPSNVPVPPVRYTPAPMTAPSIPTPMPGQMPSPYHTPTPPPGLYATPSPTTLGSSAGEVQGKRGKAGFVFAGVVVVAAAVVAIVVATRGGSKPEAANEPPVAADAAVVAVADAAVAPPPVDAAEVAVTPGTGSGSGSAGSGSAVTVEPKVAKITIVTEPKGARIFVNGVDMETLTPNPVELPHGTKPVKITLKLDGYKDHVFEKVMPDGFVNLEKTLSRKRVVVVPPTGKGSNGKGSGSTGKGKGSNDTGLIRPGD